MATSSPTFVSNVSKLLTGNVLAQSAGIIAAPILTRLFAPEAFGIAALFTSITAVIGVSSCLRYELSIMLPEKDEEAANLLWVSICFVLFVSGLTALLVLLAGDVIADLFGDPRLKKYLWVLPLAVLIEGNFWAFSYWNSRTKHFGRLSIAKVVSSAVALTTMLIAGFAGFVTGGVLIGSTVFGIGMATLILGSKTCLSNLMLFKQNVSFERMVAGIKKYKRFPIYSTWSAVLNMTSYNLPVWALAFYFSPKIVGFFALARTVLNQPIRMLGNAISQVFFQKASEVNKLSSGNLPGVVEQVFKRLVVLGLLPLLLLTLIGKDLFSVAFGAQWGEAGVYVQILSLWMFLQFISSPITTLFSILEKQNLELIFNVILFIARSISLIIGGLTGDIKITLFLLTGSGVFCYGFLCFWLISSAGVCVSHVLRQITRYTCYGAPMLMVTAFAKWSLKMDEIWVLSVGLFCIMWYYFLLIRWDRELRKALWGLFRSFDLIR